MCCENDTFCGDSRRICNATRPFNRRQQRPVGGNVLRHFLREPWSAYEAATVQLEKPLVALAALGVEGLSIVGSQRHEGVQHDYRRGSG